MFLCVYVLCESTQKGNTERKHRQKTQRENTKKKHREKTQTENTDSTNVFVVVFLWWCGWVVFLWWCGLVLVTVVVFLWWCFCVFVAVFLCGVFVAVFLWWCFCGGVFVVQNTRRIRRPELPKRSFRAMLPTIFTEKASKMIVSCEASDNFHRTSFQNDRFVRGFRNFSRNKLPKRAFRARLPPNFTELASKTSVSHDASDNFHRRSFQKDARLLLPNFTEEASKTSVSRDNFPRKSFQNDHFVRGFLQIS